MATDLSTVRSEFAVTESWAYLNHASYGPFPRRTVEAVAAVAAEFANPATMDSAEREAAVDAARQHIAALVNGEPDQVAFVGNLADAMSLCAAGLELEPGDNVVIPVQEFPSVVYPFLNLGRRGVEVRFVEKDEHGYTDLARIEAAIDERTRALVLSHVEFMDGYCNDLHAIGQLCQARDILSIVDATQSMGPVPIDVAASGIDVVAAHSYKWLMASFGIGAMHFSTRAIERIHPTYAGRAGIARSFEDLDYELDWQPGALRYQTGGINWISLSALNASAELIREIGTAEIYRQTLELTERILDGVAERGYQPTSCRDRDRRSAIVSFTTGDPETDGQFVQDLEAEQVSVALRGKGIRVSPYFYNNQEDVERLLDALPQR